MSKFAESIETKAPAEAVWGKLADIGGIHRWNPGVVASKMTSEGEAGPGATRRCELGGKNYLDEEIVKWIVFISRREMVKNGRRGR